MSYECKRITWGDLGNKEDTWGIDKAHCKTVGLISFNIATRYYLLSVSHHSRLMTISFFRYLQHYNSFLKLCSFIFHSRHFTMRMIFHNENDISPYFRVSLIYHNGDNVMQFTSLDFGNTWLSLLVLQMWNIYSINFNMESLFYV